MLIVSLLLHTGACLALDVSRRSAVRRRVALRAATLESGTDTLDIAELMSRFADVKAHFREQGDLSEETINERLMRTRVANLELNRVEVRDSTVHGKGLFATRDIEQGELMTLYPGDAMLLWEDDDKAARRVGCKLRAQFGTHISAEEQAAADFFLGQEHARSYEIAAASRFSLVGDPARSADPAYLAHFANDAAFLSEGTDAAREAYSRESVSKSNAAVVVVERCHYAAVSTRDIKTGDEVFFSYGEGYWLSRAGAEATAEARANDLKRKKTVSKEKRKLAPVTKLKKKKGFGA